MSTTKLTLSIPEELLDQVKAYSKKARKPLSQLVSQYFLALLQTRKTGDEQEVTALVKKATGLVKNDHKDRDILWEALSEKHLR